MNMTSDERMEYTALLSDAVKEEADADPHDLARIPKWMIKAACLVYCKMGAAWLSRKCGC